LPFGSPLTSTLIDKNFCISETSCISKTKWPRILNEPYKLKGVAYPFICQEECLAMTRGIAVETIRVSSGVVD